MSIRQLTTEAAPAKAWLAPAARLLPGIAMTALIALIAIMLHRLPVLSNFSPMILAILIGTTFHNILGAPAIAKPGIAFSMRRILRLAIILLGLQLTAAQVAAVGFSGVAIIVAGLVCTFAFTVFMGRVLKVDPKLAELIAAGTSICGASAVICTNTVTEAKDEDVVYAVACVTVFGSLAMFLYPLLPGLLHLDAHAFGLWTGASIHEIAQVVAAAFQDGQQAGQFGTVAKLTRVMMLAPMVIALGVLAARKARHAAPAEKRKAPPLPWFVLGFIALVALNSVFPVPASVKPVAVTVTTFLLSMALAAMGLETEIRKLRAKGLRPLLLGACAWLFIGAFTLTLIKLTGA
jgi:uncharacterized integral membrane protein (TIGR00698 family)